MAQPYKRIEERLDERGKEYDWRDQEIYESLIREDRSLACQFAVCLFGIGVATLMVWMTFKGLPWHG